MKLFCTLLAFTCILVSTSDSKGELIQNFKTDTDSSFVLAGTTYTRTLVGLMDNGVTFDATLTVTGFSPTAAGNIDVGGSGVGVSGAGNGANSNLVNDGESLRFTMMTSNEMGGTVAFNGFTAIDFNSLTNGDTAVFSSNNSQTVGVFQSIEAPSAGSIDVVNIIPTQTSFFAIAVDGDGTGVNNSFRVDDVSGSFSGSILATPEPTSFVMFGFAMAGFGFRRRRRI